MPMAFCVRNDHAVLLLPVILLIRGCSGWEFEAVPCPKGTDTPGMIMRDKTCAELITESTKYECYEQPVRNECCQSCNDIMIGKQFYQDVDPPGHCVFGDHVPNCLPFLCSSVANKQDCCETCHDYLYHPDGVGSHPLHSEPNPQPNPEPSPANSAEGTNAAAATGASASTGGGVGGIVGGVIGGLAGVAILGLGIYFGVRKYKKKKAEEAVP